MITVVSWNIAMSSRAVEELLVMDAAVALLRGGWIPRPWQPGGQNFRTGLKPWYSARRSIVGRIAAVPAVGQRSGFRVLFFRAIERVHDMSDTHTGSIMLIDIILCLRHQVHSCTRR